MAEKFNSMLEACSRPTGGLLAPFNSFRTEVDKNVTHTKKQSKNVSTGQSENTSYA